MVFYPGDMSCPAKLCFDEHGLDAGNLSRFKDLDVSDAPYRKVVNKTAL